MIRTQRDNHLFLEVGESIIEHRRETRLTAITGTVGRLHHEVALGHFINFMRNSFDSEKRRKQINKTKWLKYSLTLTVL